MHTDVFYHLFWQSLTLSKWGGPLSMGPRVKAVHRDLTKWGGELLLTAPQVVISATGEATLIFFAWQISNIMHCQIILNMASVTRWPRSQYSDLLWLINSAATACHWPINQDISNPPSSSSASSNSSSPVSPFEYEVALGWLPQNKPLGEQGLAKLFYTCRNFDWGICIALLCQWMWQPLSPPVRGPLQIYLHIIRFISSFCGKSQGFYKSIWIFASNVDTHCLNRLLQNSLANTVAWNERLRQCLL